MAMAQRCPWDIGGSITLSYQRNAHIQVLKWVECFMHICLDYIRGVYQYYPKLKRSLDYRDYRVNVFWMFAVSQSLPGWCISWMPWTGGEYNICWCNSGQGHMFETCHFRTRAVVNEKWVCWGISTLFLWSESNRFVVAAVAVVGAFCSQDGRQDVLYEIVCSPCLYH